MPFIKYILEENIPCPRCNADSQIRAEDNDDIVAVYHICSFCKFRKFVRITSRRALELEKREKKYVELLNRSDKIEKNYKILARIKKIQKERQLLELGIRRNNGRRKRAK